MVGGGEQLDDSGLVLAKNAYDTALNFYVVRGHHDRSHFGICRLQADLARAFAIEALERCFFATNQRNNDIPGIGDLGLLANDKVPVHDVIFDHGTPFDLQNKGIAATSEIAQRNRLAFFNSFQRAPRRDPSHQWKLLHLAIVYLILDRLRQLDNLDGAALIVPAPYKAFFLESGNVLVHGGQRSELEALANFFEAWRVAVLGLKRHEVIENFFLPFGECHAPPPLAKDSHRHFRRKESERQAQTLRSPKGLAPLRVYVELLCPKSLYHPIVMSVNSMQTLGEVQPPLPRSAVFGRGLLFWRD